ncbi:unnamed protein product, partial [Chrysoparadoxa australica]
GAPAAAVAPTYPPKLVGHSLLGALGPHDASSLRSACSALDQKIATAEQPSTSGPEAEEASQDSKASKGGKPAPALHHLGPSKPAMKRKRPDLFVNTSIGVARCFPGTQARVAAVEARQEKLNQQQAPHRGVMTGAPQLPLPVPQQQQPLRQGQAHSLRPAPAAAASTTSQASNSEHIQLLLNVLSAPG